jgi:ectoine hydroxylase-related dioxygenase (phytanoyl-CoA dioxygenase family)
MQFDISPVFSLEKRYSITREQTKSFQDNGHILLRNVAPEEEISHFQPLISRASRIHNPESRKLEDRDTYGKAFLQTMNLWQVNKDIKKFVLAKRFAQIAADLLGVEKVRLYHDQALFKEPEGGYTPWHQDQYYWPLDTDKTITMWMPLVDISSKMGMLTFAGGSNLEGHLKSTKISDHSEKFFKEYIAEKGFPIESADFMKAGDATFHSGLTIHSAPENNSDKMREVMTIIYFADGAKVTEPKNENQEADRIVWLRSIEPGKLADSELNPVVN